MRPRFVLSVVTPLILVATTSCDNVNWGGADVAVVPPPPVTRGVSFEGEAVEERVPQGPVLFYVVPAEGGATMVPVAEIASDSLIRIRPTRDPAAFANRFIAEHMRQGAEFALFREGARVGTFVVQATEVPPANACPFLPRARGNLQLSSGAEQIPEFLAIAEPYAPEISRRAGPALQINRNMQVLSPILAERLLRARGAQLPGNWQRAMAQLEPIPITGAAGPGYAATFLVSDDLKPGGDNNGYSLFYVGVPSQFSYDTAYVEFHNYPATGKAAPRLVDFLDWNRDEQPDLLLQVYGLRDVWFEAVSRSQRGQWRRVFQDRCEQGTSTMPLPGPTLDSMTTTSADSISG